MSRPCLFPIFWPRMRRCGVGCEAGQVRLMRGRGRVCLGTFEPFLAKCAAVRTLRVIEGMMLEGVRMDKNESMQGLTREETEGHKKKDGIVSYLAKQWHVMWRNRCRWSSGVKPAAGREGFGQDSRSQPPAKTPPTVKTWWMYRDIATKRWNILSLD